MPATPRHAIAGLLETSREHQDLEQALLTAMHIEIAGRPPE